MGVRVEVHSETVGLLLLDRPEKAHAYDHAHLDLFEAGLRDLEPKVRVIVVGSTGAGAFCGGADMDEMKTSRPEDALDLRSQLVFTALARSPRVTIAAVHGPAVAGGFELAMACDLRLAGRRAWFELPEPLMGIIPSAGGCTRLVRLVGVARAKEVILGGRRVDPGTALAWGLVSRVSDDPMADALAMAGEVARRDPMALRLAKQILDRGEDAGSLDEERLAEAVLYARKP